MFRHFRVLVFGIPLVLGGPVSAQETDEEEWEDFDLLGEEEEDEDEAPPPEWEEEDLLDDDEDESLELFEDAEDEEDELLFDDEEGGPELVEEGQDSPTTYRDATREFETFAPDEEVMAWENYLLEYPKSLYFESIQRRIKALMSEQYDSAVEQVVEARSDAARREIFLESSMLLDNINPRGRLHVGFEFGYPSWADLNLDYEHPFVRSVSAHLGIRRRATGFGIEIGPRWAFVKSTRTQTIATLFVDARLNFNPVFASIRPHIGAARIFGPFQIQGQAGVDIELRPKGGVRLLGGMRVSYRLAPTVGVYAETSMQMKNLTWDGGPFSFYVASFGIKLFPNFKALRHDPIEVGAGASAPYYKNYWQYHFGSALMSMDYYTTN